MESTPGQKIESKDYQKFIPLDKYWTIRMGILDIIHGYKDINTFLNEQKDLGGDLSALKRVCETWNTNQSVDVGESGTLFRYLQFASWKYKLNKQFIKRGTLSNRQISNNPDIVNWDLKRLLTLDGGTSQWASISVLLGNQEVIENAPYFLKVTYEAKKHWEEKRKEGKIWEPKHDEVLLKQADYFVNLLNSKPAAFIPTNPDDYCFSRAFGIISREEGEKRFPMIKHHESNRLDEMEKVIDQAERGEPIDSKDHRVIQAMAMWGIVNKKKLTFTHPEAVNKTWPQFWDFLEEVQNKV